MRRRHWPVVIEEREASSVVRNDRLKLTGLDFNELAQVEMSHTALLTSSSRR